MKTNRRKFILTAASAGLGAVALTNGLPLTAAAAPSRSLRARIVSVGGVLKIEINGQIFEPLSFRSFRPEERNIREFHQAGVRLMSVLHTGMDCTLDVPYSKFGEIWTGPGQYDFAAFDRQMDLFIKNAPDTYFNIMLQLDTRQWFLKNHPEHPNSFWNLVETAGDPAWRARTAEALQAMIRHSEEKYGDRVFSYSLFCGSSTEWYTNSQGRGRPDARIRQHPMKTAAFRKFTGDSTAEMPPLDVLQQTSHGILRDPMKDADALRYWKFHHDIIGDAIVYFCAKTQDVIQHRKLLGIFYGYLTQLNSERLLQEGHLAYERVWNCPDLDIIYAPAKYGKPRAFEGASGYLLTVDSLRLRNKMVWHELDHTTYIAPTKVENGRAIPGSGSKLKDEFQTRMVLRREFALSHTKLTAMWWFDFFGGYYYAKPLMQEVANLVRVQQRLKNVAMDSVAQIAVFGDVRSMFHINARSSIADDLLVNPPDELARIGAPFDIYNFSDIGHTKLPLDRYKLCIFLNAFLISDEQKEIIRKKFRQHGKTLLWLYAPGYIRADGFSLDGIAEITGIKVAQRTAANSHVRVDAKGNFAQMKEPARFGFTPGQATDATKRDQTFDMRSQGLMETAPLFQVNDPAAETWGVYGTDGAVALAARKLENHTSVYCAVGNIPAAVFREIARHAGVHIYYEGNDPVYINSRLIGIHMQSDTAPVITLPLRKPCRLEELLDGGEVRGENGVCHLPREAGVTKLYLLADAIR